MASNDVGGIDIIVRKKPGGGIVNIQLMDTGNGNLVVTNIMGAQAADYQSLRQIGELMGALLTGNLTNASFRLNRALGSLRAMGAMNAFGSGGDAQMRGTYNTTKSNIKTNG